MQIVSGGETEFNGLIYGDKHPGTLSFLQNQLTTGLSQTLTDVGKRVYSSLGAMFEKFNGSEAMHLIKAARRKVSNVFQQDVIRPLWDIEEIQQATLVMQRWIMAMPEIRKLYHDQRCDGFSTTYQDMQPDVIGRKHYDYRCVLNGLAQTEEDGTLKITYFYDEEHPDDATLSLEDKKDITNTWEYVRYFLAKGERDPSSKLGEYL